MSDKEPQTDADTGTFEQLLTVSDVAKILNIHENSVRSRYRAGTIPGGIRLEGGTTGRGTIRFRPEVIRAWLDQLEAGVA